MVHWLGRIVYGALAGENCGWCIGRGDLWMIDWRGRIVYGALAGENCGWCTGWRGFVDGALAGGFVDGALGGGICG